MVPFGLELSVKAIILPFVLHGFVAVREEYRLGCLRVGC
jgi:hypothetical protein